MENKPEIKEEIAKEVNQKLTELAELEQTSAILKDNISEFVYKNDTYRVHRPVAWEKDECNKERMKKYVEFLQDPKYLFKKQLVLLLANKGVDILAMEEETKRLYTQERELLKRLAQTSMEPDISTLKNEISDVRYLQQQNFMEKEELLKYCIEKQLEDCVRFYLLFLVLEIKVGDKWEKLYKTYQEFQNANDDVLLGRAAQVLAYLVYHENI